MVLLFFLSVFVLVVCLLAPCPFNDVGSAEALAAGRCLDEYYIVFRARIVGYIVCFGAGALLVAVKLRAVTSAPRRGSAQASLGWTGAASPDLYEESLNSIRATSIIVGLTIGPLALLLTAAYLAPAIEGYYRTGAPLDAVVEEVCGDSELCVLGKRFNGVLEIAVRHVCAMAGVRYLSMPSQIWSSTMATAMGKKHGLRRVRLRREPYLMLVSMALVIYTNVHRELRDVPNVAGAAGEVAAIFLVEIVSLVFNLFSLWNSMIPQDTLLFLRALLGHRCGGAPLTKRMLPAGWRHAGAEANSSSFSITSTCGTHTVISDLNQSSTGQRREVLLLTFALVLCLDGTSGVTLFQTVIVYAARIVLASLILLLREREANFDQLKNSPGFGLVVSASSLRRALLCALQGRPFLGRLPAYKGTAARMEETLAVSYRWQEEQVQISRDCALNMGPFQLEALATAIKERGCSYVWLDCLSVPQHACDLKYTLLARMMAVYASAADTVVLRSVEAPGSRYHQRVWTCQEFCIARRLHVVTQAAEDEDDAEAAMVAVREEEEGEIEELRRELQLGGASLVPLWLREDPFTAEEAQAVVAKFRMLSSRLSCIVVADKIRALLPLLAQSPVEGQGELVQLVHRLGCASGEDLQAWKGELLEQHVCIKRSVRRSSLVLQMASDPGLPPNQPSLRKSLSHMSAQSNISSFVSETDSVPAVHLPVPSVRHSASGGDSAAPSKPKLTRFLSERPARKTPLEEVYVRPQPKKNVTFASLAAAHAAARVRKEHQRRSLCEQAPHTERAASRGPEPSPLARDLVYTALQSAPVRVAGQQHAGQRSGGELLRDAMPQLPGAVPTIPSFRWDSARSDDGGSERALLH
eukprot:jgi/Tetstr1/429655/TSEL_019552.t1